uniref:Putative type III restriction enzyme n=2 Tax=viral metagenome TaxID=1070528 RepID=A0A6M3IFH8_9ZZZZ
MELREYQTQAINKLRERFLSGRKRIVLQAACAAGKTIIAAELSRAALNKGKHVLFIVNRRDLVKQTVEKFEQYGIGDRVGTILAGEEPELTRPVQVASFQTYSRRLKLDDLDWNAWYHKAELVIYDECHSCNAKTYREIIDIYKDNGGYIIGLTATPCRADGTGLGEVFEDIVTCVPIEELIDKKFLVPMVYYAPSKPDLSKLRTVAGDYEQKELGNRVDKPKLIGDIYDNWIRLAGDRPTIIFATNVKHSMHIAQHFSDKGISIEHIDAHTNDLDRVGIYGRFEEGKTQVLTNVGICTEGSDLPWVACVVVARPTKSLGRWIQMAGRGLRPFPGKEQCILMDHAGCVEAHGFVDEDIEWSLEGKKAAFKKKKPRVKEKTPMICEMCAFCFTGPKCPQCGHEVKFWGKKIEAIEADLEEIKRPTKRKYTMFEKGNFYGMLEWERRRKGYAEGWTSHKFKEKFGVWPNSFKGTKPIEPDITFLNYLKHLRIKWAKSKGNPKNLEATG